MYINDVITMTELKEKTAEINEALKDLDYSLKQYEQSLAAAQNGEELVAFYVEEIERFLRLETVTNLDLRRIIDHISVNRDGTAKIILKKLDDMAASDHLPNWCQL